MSFSFLLRPQSDPGSTSVSWGLSQASTGLVHVFQWNKDEFITLPAEVIIQASYTTPHNDSLCSQ
ncbi:hypothetical protein Baya_12906 [Bagarius yarrelli]|uniref:Uncharacterized protein n=1 Tax=Bagarius yarrelli TaxID=175774 RepID=A0A556V4F8_BAGYA|nr:hypothetical protein Baya_12906 [Bagarius yarrelli]